MILSIINTVASRAAAGVKRQTVLVSATLSSQVQELADMSLKEHITINLAASQPSMAVHAAACTSTTLASLSSNAVAAENGVAAGDARQSLAAWRLEAPAELRQSYVVLSPKARLTALAGFLRSKCVEVQACKVLVFVSSCDGVDFLFKLLSQGAWPEIVAARAAAGSHASAEAVKQRAQIGVAMEKSYHDDADFKSKLWRKPRASVSLGAPSADVWAGVSCPSALLGTQVLRLHGNLEQKQRLAVFQRFRKLRGGVLLCTDVAARGLNLEEVNWIIQFDLPQDAREYVHRVGRTARMGQLGQVSTYFHRSIVQEHRTSLKLAVHYAPLCEPEPAQEPGLLPSLTMADVDNGSSDHYCNHDYAPLTQDELLFPTPPPPHFTPRRYFFSFLTRRHS